VVDAEFLEPIDLGRMRRQGIDAFEAESGEIGVGDGRCRHHQRDETAEESARVATRCSVRVMRLAITMISAIRRLMAGTRPRRPNSVVEPCHAAQNPSNESRATTMPTPVMPTAFVVARPARSSR